MAERVAEAQRWLLEFIERGLGRTGLSKRGAALKASLRSETVYNILQGKFPRFPTVAALAHLFSQPTPYSEEEWERLRWWRCRGRSLGGLAKANRHYDPASSDDWLVGFREWLIAVLSDTTVTMQGASVKADLSPSAVRGILRDGRPPLPKTVKRLVQTFGAPSEAAERWGQGAREALKRKGAKIRATRELRHPEKYRHIESVCLHCGKPLSLWSSQVGRRKHCSRRCIEATQRKNLTLSDQLHIYLWREMTVVRGVTNYTGIAKAWGVSYGCVAYYFGHNAFLTTATLEKIAAYLGVEVAYLVSLQGGITADDRRRDMSREKMLALIQTLPRGPLSPETRARISAANQGKPWSPERKAAYYEDVLSDPKKVSRIRKGAVEASQRIARRLRTSLATYCQHLGREPTPDELESFAARKVRDLGLPAGSQSTVLNLFKEKLGWIDSVPAGGRPPLESRYDFVRQLRDKTPRVTWKETARAVETKEGLPEYSLDHESLRRWFSRFSNRQATALTVAS